MFRARGSVEIKRETSELSAFLADPSNDEKWQRGLVHYQALSGAPGAVGLKFERVQEMMGRKLKSTMELVTVQPGRQVAYKGAGKIIEFRVEYALAAAGAGATRVEMSFEGDLTGFAAMFESVAAEQLEKELPLALAKLKTVLERT